MHTQNVINQWLNEHKSNGVNVCLKELLYYQKKAHLLDLKPSKQIKHHLAGQYLAPHKGRGMEFAEVRHYQQGDDVRAIDWRVTARTGVAHTKLYQEEKERPVFIVADFSETMLFGSQYLLKSVQAAHLSSLIAWAACARGDRIGGLVFNQHEHVEIKPGSRQKAVLGLLHHLVEMHQKALDYGITGHSINLVEQLKRLSMLAKPGSLVYLISDFSQLNDKAAKQLLNLSRHCEVQACHLFDPFEQALPASDESIDIFNGTEKHSLPLASRQFRSSFKQHATQRVARLNQQLLRAGLHPLAFSAATPLTQQITKRT